MSKVRLLVGTKKGAFVLTSDGVVLHDQSDPNPDYFFIYNAATDTAIFRPSAGTWPGRRPSNHIRGVGVATVAE